mgnify:CR=1 FL=1
MTGKSDIGGMWNFPSHLSQPSRGRNRLSTRVRMQGCKILKTLHPCTLPSALFHPVFAPVGRCVGGERRSGVPPPTDGRFAHTARDVGISRFGGENHLLRRWPASRLSGHRHSRRPPSTCLRGTAPHPSSAQSPHRSEHLTDQVFRTTLPCASSPNETHWRWAFVWF